MKARSPLSTAPVDEHVVLFDPALGVVVGGKALDQHGLLLERAGALDRGDDHRTRAIAVEAAIKHAKRIDDQPSLVIILDGHRLLHLRFWIAQRVLAERRGDRGEIVARRAVFEHVPARAEGVLRHRAEMAELRADARAGAGLPG